MISPKTIQSLYTNLLKSFEQQPTQISQGGQVSIHSEDIPPLTCMLTKDTLRIADHIYVYTIEASMGFLTVGVSLDTLFFEDEQHIALIRAGMVTHNFTLPQNLKDSHFEKIAPILTQLCNGEELVESQESIVHLQFKKIS